MFKIIKINYNKKDIILLAVYLLMFIAAVILIISAMINVGKSISNKNKQSKIKEFTIELENEPIEIIKSGEVSETISINADEYVGFKNIAIGSENISITEMQELSLGILSDREAAARAASEAASAAARSARAYTEAEQERVSAILTKGFEYNGIELTIPEQYTEEDLRILATMVYWENGKCQNDITVYFYDNYDDPQILPCHAMHQWTAQVCLNHVMDSRFPNTVYDDMCGPRYTTEYRSMSWTLRAMNESPEVWEDVVRDCLIAMNGLVDAPSNMIFQSNYTQLGTHFASVYVDTGWFRSWSYFSTG